MGLGAIDSKDLCSLLVWIAEATCLSGQGRTERLGNTAGRLEGSNEVN